MSEYKAPLQDLDFLFKKVFDLPAFWAQFSKLEGVDTDTADAILEGAAKLCEQVLAPLNRESDEEGCHWSAQGVESPKGFKNAYAQYCEGGWGTLGGNPEYDGMGMPKTLVSAIEEMVQGACMSFGLAPMLTAGATLSIDAHASDEIKALYLPKMYAGEWTGAMDLTEPHCGTDLGLIRTKAQPVGDGSFKVTGTKIFITWGEHDMADNIVHLVLAKLPDALPGSKGISMFLVPKFIPDAKGNLGERNTLSCGSIEKKMGIKGSATCVMNFDGATGWLVGGENQGLAGMFTMMNYERLVVGIQGIGAAEASYQSAAEYARDRLQSRSAQGAKYPDKPADPLLVHPDVRRMLLTMRAFNEGGRAFYTYAATWLDRVKFSEDADTKKYAKAMVDLLTPVAKAFMTDVALETAIQGQQVLGGHGFIKEWGQEQLVRDIRITQIYEGTNGIQAMDLIGRKTVATKGELCRLLVTDIRQSLKKTDQNFNKIYAIKLEKSLVLLEKTTQLIVAGSAKDKNFAGAVAVDYLNFLGYVCYAYMWIKMEAAARQMIETKDNEAFAQAKCSTAQFYFDKILPRTESLAIQISSGADAVMSLAEDSF